MQTEQNGLGDHEVSIFGDIIRTCKKYWYACGGLNWLKKNAHPIARSLSLLKTTGHENRKNTRNEKGKKKKGLRLEQADCLPTTAVGKSDSTWGKLV